MKDYIKQALVGMYKTTTTDRYGQVSKFNFSLSNLFGDKADAVEAYAKKNPGFVSVSTYGSSVGTYKAITIEDKELRSVCSDALKQNKNYINNMKSW
jgi:hypothetical protein